MFRSVNIRQPEEFIPERWQSDDSEADVLKELHVPFASGKRNCIGQNLALWELRLLVATLFRRFEFELVNEVTYDYFLTLKPVDANFK
eukprot:gene41593-55144_t